MHPPQIIADQNGILKYHVFDLEEEWMSVGYCFDWWLMWEGPGLCGQCHPWEGDPELYKKVDWADQRIKLIAAFLQGLFFSNCPDFPHWQTTGSIR